MYNNNCQL